MLSRWLNQILTGKTGYISCETDHDYEEKNRKGIRSIIALVCLPHHGTSED